ncbi:MAG: exodeoxyribonuclease III [Neisseriaceae bacterium]|nr:exodeoxyribonuclease III [Neisseriaceae bacterium]
MKIATWNVNSLNVRLEQVIEWLNKHQPDVLALQELKQEQNKFPINEFTKINYNAAWLGQKTYNGVALICKDEISDIVYGMTNFTDEQSRVISATYRNIRFICVYCVNGESIDSEKFIYKQQWFDALNQHIIHEKNRYDNCVVLGDFNIAPADIDVYDPQKWQGKILCSDIERECFCRMLALGFSDSIRELSKEKQLFTWWDYRMNSFRRNLGMRIDHILLTPQLMQCANDFGVDTEQRAQERPSDHAPVWIECNW